MRHLRERVLNDEKQRLLDEVSRILGDRGRSYGTPQEHHAATAVAVNAILGLDLSPRDVALFFVVDKLVRMRRSPDKRDHYLDGVGYLSIAWEHTERELR